MSRLRANFGRLAHPMQDVHINLREYWKAPPFEPFESSRPKGACPSCKQKNCEFSRSFLLLHSGSGFKVLFFSNQRFQIFFIHFEGDEVSFAIDVAHFVGYVQDFFSGEAEVADEVAVASHRR